MILLNSIKSMGETSPKKLSSIADEYLTRVKKDISPYIHLKDIKDGKDIKIKNEIIEYKDFEKSELSYLKQLYTDFDKLITSIPEDLEKLVSTYDESLIGDYVKSGFGSIKFKLNPFGIKVLKIFGYDHYFRNRTKKGIWYAKQLNCRSCPYCNANYTLLTNRKSKSTQAKFQFDHFLSKKKYPYLSVSMYNLIPTCANCNLSKGEKPFHTSTHYHPFSRDFSLMVKFSLDYKAELGRLSMGKVDSLPISIKFKSVNSANDSLVENHDEIFNISGIYQRMEDDARRLLRTSIVKNQAYKRSLKKIRNLFPENKIYLEYLIGTDPFRENILNKPLTKFTQDIAIQLRLI